MNFIKNNIKISAKISAKTTRDLAINKIIEAAFREANDSDHL